MSGPLQPRRRLESISVHGLFGQFNHDIDFNQDSRITLLHGPNGVGKTTLLRMIEGVSRPDSPVWWQTEFEKVVAVFSTQEVLLVEKQGDATLFKLSTFDRPSERYLLSRHDAMWWNTLRMRSERGQRRVGGEPEVWRDQRGELQVVQLPLPLLPDGPPGRAIQGWLASLTDQISIRLIDTHRLGSGGDEASGAVGRVATGVARRISDVLRESGSRSAESDRTLPARLLERELPSIATEERIRREFTRQQGIWRRLMGVGIQNVGDVVELPQRTLDECDRRVLWHYITDAEQKLDVFGDLLGKLEMFQSIIAEKNFLNKSMVLTQEAGVHFDAHSGRRLPVAMLSSGEQHELLLSYELIFESERQSMLLVDEPELSLHVLWQRSFLRDLLQIASLVDVDFVVATHSPAIVSHYTDLLVELKGY